MARKSRRGNRRMKQSLVYSSAINSTAGTATTIAASSLNFPTNRPAKPVYVEFEFYSTAPRSFFLRVYGSAGEEVFNSPTILSGPIPRKRRFVMPANTDFGIYTGTESVVQFTHATNPSINFVVNIMMEHKFIPPLVNF